MNYADFATAEQGVGGPSREGGPLSSFPPKHKDFLNHPVKAAQFLRRGDWAEAENILRFRPLPGRIIAKF